MDLIPWQLLVAGLVAQLTPTDPSIRPENFLSVSCPSNKACLILDQVGTLYFSADSGRHLIVRSSLRRIGLRKIRFAGLLDGWGLDQKGGLWRTRNGGRTFEAVSVPGKARAVDLALGPGGVAWTILGDGTAYRWEGRRFVVVGAGSPVPPVALAGGPGLLAMVGEDGLVSLFWPGAEEWSRSRAFSTGNATGLAVGNSGQVAVFGCGGVVRWSSDRGRSWSDLAFGGAENGWKTLCPTAGWFLPDGRLLLLGWPGKAVLGDPRIGALRIVEVPFDRNLRDGSVSSAGALLVGDGGALALLEVGPGAEVTVLPLAKCRPGVTDIKFLPGARKIYRSYMTGDLEVSTDGGVSWSALSAPGREATRLSPVDEQRCFALVGSQTIVATSDGGRTWTQLARWSDVSLTDLFFVDRVRGWAVGHQGCVVRTTDAGKSWTLDRLPTDGEALYRVQFVDAKRGWVVGGHQTVFRTENGGQSWEKLRSGRGLLVSIHFELSGEGWVGGEEGLVLHTQDGGKSWLPGRVPSGEMVHALSFVDSYHGLAGGGRGTLFLTIDGGSSWKPVDVSTEALISTISCWKVSGQCLVGGERGLFLAGAPFRLRR